MQHRSDDALYNRIGSGYDTTRRADPHITSRLAALLEMRAGAQYLDLACGTGNYTLALNEYAKSRWTGCDNSARMLRAARAKRGEAQWCVADVNQLPFAAGHFAGMLCINAIHHFPNMTLLFAEARRVMARGARFVLFSATQEQMHHYWLNDFFPVAMRRSILKMPQADTLTQAARHAGFHLSGSEAYHVQPDLRDRFLYSGKHDPARYLDAQVRAGISTFAADAALTEVENGCKRLAQTLERGVFPEITEHPDGDYTFWMFDAV